MGIKTNPEGIKKKTERIDMTNENGNGATFSEAPASINLRFNYQGYNGIMLTLRAGSGLDVLAKLDGALIKLGKMGATPAGANGRAADPNAPLCPTHGTPGRKSTHGEGYYCPRKVAETGGGQDGSKPIYCKAKLG
jgi:hypothetical protein